MNTQVMPSSLLWPILILVLVVILVWCLLLIGTWACFLAKNSIIKKIALKEEYARRIMDALVTKLIPVIAAISLLVISILQTMDYNNTFQNTNSKLLCELMANGNKPGYVELVNSFKDTPSSLGLTLKAYSEYYHSTKSPEIDAITDMLPSKKNVFDYRLLAYVNTNYAVYKKNRLTKTDRINYAKSSLTNIDEAFKLVSENRIPGNPDKDSKRYLIGSLYNARGNAYTLLSEEENTQMNLDRAKESFNKGLDSVNSIPHLYINLGEVDIGYALLTKDNTYYESAIRTVTEAITSRTTLDDYGKWLVREIVKDPSSVDKYRFLEQYYNHTHPHDTWINYIDTKYNQAVKE